MLTGMLFMLVLTALPEDTLWTTEGEGYEIAVRYPQIALENEELGTLLEAYAMESVIEFERQCDEWMAEGDPYPIDWVLELNMYHEPSPDGMICIMVWRWDYMGGAHGNTYTSVLNYREATMESIGVVELLGSQEEFELFTEKVIAQILQEDRDREWVLRGAAPEPENYHSVLPVPDEDGEIEGYTVFFPPYQVDCYACGTVEVFIPSQ